MYCTIENVQCTVHVQRTRTVHCTVQHVQRTCTVDKYFICPTFLCSRIIQH